MNQKDSEWLEQKDVAKKLGISIGQVSRYMSQYPPPWPYYRVTVSKKLTKSSDLDAWLEKVKVSAATQDLV